MFIIYKSQRLPELRSYAGNLWDRAGIRHRWRSQYDSKEEAEELAEELSKWSILPFLVMHVDDVLKMRRTILSNNEYKDISLGNTEDPDPRD